MTFPRRPRFTALILLLVAVPLAHGQLTFTTIDVPGAGLTSVQGINAVGDVVGYYGESGNDASHAFLLQGGSFTFFDYPGANSTRAMGINDAGLIVDYTVGIRERGFTFDGNTFTPIRAANKTATVTLGINNAADIVGGVGTIYTTQGFEMRGGHFKTVSPPGQYVYVYATGVNNLGKVVGWDDAGGFAYNRGKFQFISFPGANQTEAWGINDAGTVVGWYGMGASVFGFALLDRQYISFAYPGALYTLAFGINASGQIVGAYTFDNITWHGFVTSSLTLADFESPTTR
jgi:uncharacterized membrane protein